MSRYLLPTIGNEQWVRENEGKLKELLPETFTHMQNMNLLKIGFGLKLLGVDWRDPAELPQIMAFFERVGLLVREGMAVKRNANKVFK